MLDITSKTNFYYFGILQLNGQEREQCWQRSNNEKHCAPVLGAARLGNLFLPGVTPW